MRIETIHNSLMQSCTYIIEDGRANMSYMYVDDFSVQNDKMFQFINNRENVYVFNQKLTAIHTPGHDIDCMCYLINDSCFCFLSGRNRNEITIPSIVDSMI